VRATVISIGTELATGQTVDTNSAWLSVRLTGLGVEVTRHVTVGDDGSATQAAIRGALSGPDALVVMTGGLGPTADDLTRFALADVLGVPLQEVGEALRHIRAFFERRQRSMPESNRLQALIPHGCEMIPNPSGTAPGIHYEGPHGLLFALPGVPGEMKVMFERSVEPAIRARTGPAAAAVHVIHTYGTSEAQIGETLADLMQRGRNPSVGTTASKTIISVRIVARGSSPEDAARLLEADRIEIQRRLGSLVFAEGEDTLESVVGRLLIEKQKTVATAESCTGGLLAKYLTDVSGSSAYFVRGYVTYSNEAKIELLGVSRDLLARHGAVSEPVAAAMAEGCRTASQTDSALSITGIAGPTGGQPPEKPVGLVYIGLADAGQVQVKRLLFGETLPRDEIRDRACKAALNLLRRRLTAEGEIEQPRSPR
jgi:nicotinamide-nucleotide amidase